MFCQNCGRELPEGSKFCVGCGAQVAAPDMPERNFAQVPQGMQNQMPGYAQPAMAYAPVESRKKVTSRWPVVCGIMGVLYFVFYLGGMILQYGYMHMPVRLISAGMIVNLLLVIAVPVLFFVHTKKLAFLTAIPMVLLLVLNFINIFTNIRMIGRIYLSQATTLIPLVLDVILVILYVVQMIVRPRSAAMPVIYLILSIITVLFALVASVVNLIDGYGPGYILVSTLLNAIAGIFSSVAYIVAMFSSRKR